MSADLLATKLSRPPGRKNIVQRLGLYNSLTEAWQLDKKLSLVSAPAGYGKTSLVIGWLESLQANSSWLSLDRADNDPTRFLVYLIAALQKIDERIGKKTGAMLQTGQPLPPEVVLTTLINEIALVPTPFILVLDDYHLIETVQIHQQVDFLVDHQPPQMHLVIITREDPPLPLARLRARSQMIEFRQNDLRFSHDECAKFLNLVMGLNLSAAEVAALEHRTEGWIAGLQLAALSMRGQADLTGFIQAFTGSSHYVLDYLIEEVFRRQSADVQDFLLKTSILDRLSPRLCDAVANRADSREVLEQLDHSNLFIIPLDQSCSWYRYHQLFADLLRQRLNATASYSPIELHRRACQWFREERNFAEAIQHALAARDWETAAEIIQQSTTALLSRGELFTLLNWLKALPSEVVFKRPSLGRDYGWALTLTGNLDAADPFFQQAESIARDDEAQLGPILVGRAYHLRVRGDITKAIEYAQRALSILPDEDALSRSLVGLTLGLAYTNIANFREAEQAFLETDRTALVCGNHYARMTALTYLGHIQAAFGHLHRAAELCQQVIQLSRQSPSAAPAHIELAALLYEWNQLDSAMEEAQVGIEQCKQIGNPLILIDGFRILARIHQGRSDPEAALFALKNGDQLINSHQLSPLAALHHVSCHIQIALAQGDLSIAESWERKLSSFIQSVPFDPYIELASIRMMLARQEFKLAMKRSSELYEIASQKDCGTAMVEMRLLQALAADHAEDALGYLCEAIKIAQPEGFMRTFVDLGEPMKSLLERFKSEAGELRPYLLTILSAFGETSNIPPPQPLAEPLSVRELDVLRLLEQGMSNGEIARRLVVTVGTVKSHVHSIIEKLGVSSRTQAVVQARNLKLL